MRRRNFAYTKGESSLPFGVEWINATEYGFVGDGVTPNDDVMAKYIENDYMTPLYFPRGSYGFERGFDFPDLVFLELDPNAELKLIGEEIQEYFITLRRGGSHLWTYAFNSFIRGGYINCNFKAKNGLGMYKGRHTVFENFILRNVLENGIVTRTTEPFDGQSFFRNILIENDICIEGSCGFYDNGWDNHCDMMEIVNFPKGIYTICGRFVSCSAWLRDNRQVENSVFAEIDGDDVLFQAPAVDTYRIGFLMKYPHCSVAISDMLWINNEGVYNKDLQAKYPRTVFYAETDECKYMVNGLKLKAEDHIKFSNIPLPRSCFLNVRVPAGYDAPAKMENFRDDSQAIRKMGMEAFAPARILTSADDLDTLVETAVYKCSFSEKDTTLSGDGVLEVKAVADTVLQRFTGKAKTASRIKIDGKWQNWII